MDMNVRVTEGMIRVLTKLLEQQFGYEDISPAFCTTASPIRIRLPGHRNDQMPVT